MLNISNAPLLGGIALAAQAIPPIPTHFSVAWSVRRLSLSCPLLKPFDGFTCHLAGTLVVSNATLCQIGVSDPKGKGRFGGRTASQNTQLQIAAKQSVLCCQYALVDLPQRFRLLPKFFWFLYCMNTSQPRSQRTQDYFAMKSSKLPPDPFIVFPLLFPSPSPSLPLCASSPLYPARESAVHRKRCNSTRPMVDLVCQRHSYAFW